MRRVGVLLARLFPLICLLGLALPSPALEPGRKVTQFTHRVWLDSQGLPHNCVTAIRQTRDGYLWLGTQLGLVRFDGVRFTVFDKSNTPNLKNNIVQTLHEDRSGGLWIGTYGGGLTRFKDGAFTAYGTEHGLSDGTVWSIFEDRSGQMWIGTNKGLDQLRGDRFVAVPPETGSERAAVWAIAQTSDGELWLGLENGLCRVRAGRIERFPVTLSNSFVMSLLVDRTGGLWVGTRKGLNRLHGGTIEPFLRDEAVYALLEDRDGALWAATFGYGLKRMVQGKFDSFTAKNGLSTDHLLSIFEDRDGNLWIGTYDGGLNCLSRSRFLTYTTAEGLSNNLAQPILETADGALWIGTNGGGIDVLKDGRMDHFNHRDGLPNDFVMALHEDRSGTLWIGTRKGLARRSGGIIRRFSVSPQLDEANVGVITEDTSGAIWIGTQGSGLYRIAGGTTTAFSTADGLPSNTVYDLLVDRSGTLWIGTNAGLGCFRDGRFRTYRSGDGLSSDLVSCLFEDSEGNLLVGTYGNGLNLFDRGRFLALTTANGLFHDVVLAIFEGRDAFWFTSDNGVFRIRKPDLRAYFTGTTERVASIVFGLPEGLKSVACNGGMQPAGTKTRAGMAWIPTQKGVAGINIDAFVPDAAAPAPLIESLVAGDRDFPVRAAEPVLEAGSTKVEIHFTALEFANPEKIRFRFKLDGQDDRWTEAGPRRVAYYTNLAPGRYHFSVLACDNEGVWTPTDAKVSFTLKPYFYQTRAFLGLCFVGLLGMGWFFSNLRVRRLRARHAIIIAERTRIAREMHDTMVQGVVGVASQLDAVARMLTANPEIAGRHLDLARKMARHSLAEARLSLNDLRSSRLADSGLTEAVRQIVTEAARAGAGETSFSVQGESPSLSPVTEQHILRIAQESVTNAVKHAQASRIDVTLSFAPRTVLLRVSDNGNGFDPKRAVSPLDGHFGLLGMRERAERINATLTVRSIQNQGTTIDLSVPVTKGGVQ